MLSSPGLAMKHRRHPIPFAAISLLLALACTPAFAHTGSMRGGFAGGFAHPLFGPGHVGGVVGGGLWGALPGPPGGWGPAGGFPLVMAFRRVLCHLRGAPPWRAAR